jgi:hypothetical protein
MTTRARAAVAVVAAGLLAAACAGRSESRTGAPDGAPAAHHASAVLGEQIVRASIPVTPYERRAFLEMAMQPAVATDRSPVLERWERDPTLAVAGDPTPEDLRHLDDAIAAWSLLTGRHLRITGDHAAVTLHFVPKQQFASVLGVDEVDPSAVGLSRVGFAAGHRGTITSGIIVIASDDDQVTRNRTIAHELGHAMGLQHSSCASSLMDGSSDHERSVRWSPSPLDVRMAGLLYDPRLTPGIDRAEVAATLAPTATAGATCGPVDLELIRAAGTGHHYFCVRSAARIRPCTSNVSTEPTLPLRRPDAWTDGSSLHAVRPR